MNIQKLALGQLSLPQENKQENQQKRN